MFTGNTSLAVAILVVAGIPEMLTYTTYFSIIQKRIPLKEQGAFFSISVPLFNAIFALGVFTAGLHSEEYLSLNALWTTAVLLVIVPILPFYKGIKYYVSK